VPFGCSDSVTNHKLSEPAAGQCTSYILSDMNQNRGCVWLCVAVISALRQKIKSREICTGYRTYTTRASKESFFPPPIMTTSRPSTFVIAVAEYPSTCESQEQGARVPYRSLAPIDHGFTGGLDVHTFTVQLVRWGIAQKRGGRSGTSARRDLATVAESDVVWFRWSVKLVKSSQTPWGVLQYSSTVLL
jgi:hypothetical protein